MDSLVAASRYGKQPAKQLLKSPRKDRDEVPLRDDCGEEANEVESIESISIKPWLSADETHSWYGSEVSWTSFGSVGNVITVRV
jgi:hypothetical protein